MAISETKSHTCM